MVQHVGVRSPTLATTRRYHGYDLYFGFGRCISACSLLCTLIYSSRRRRGDRLHLAVLCISPPSKHVSQGYTKQSHPFACVPPIRGCRR